MARRVKNGTGWRDYFVTSGGFGSVAQIIRADTGTVVARYNYDAYGNITKQNGIPAHADQLDQEQVNQPYRFQSHYFDKTSGLTDFGFRFYSTGLGKFINQDPLEESGGINLYGFVGGNPTNSVDYYGLQEVMEIPWGELFRLPIPRAIPIPRAGSLPYVPPYEVATPVMNQAKGSGGGKNGKHANQKARDAAEQRYQEAKRDYEEAKMKPNKTPGDKDEIAKLLRAMNRAKQQRDFGGENHSQNAKGSGSIIPPCPPTSSEDEKYRRWRNSLLPGTPVA